MLSLLGKRGILLLNSARAVENATLDKTRSRQRGRGITSASEIVQLAHIDRVLEYDCDVPVIVQKRCVGRAPVAFFEAPIGATDVVLDQWYVIGTALQEHALERFLQLVDVRPSEVIRRTRKRFEQGFPDNFVAASHGSAKIGVVHAEDRQAGRQ